MKYLTLLFVFWFAHTTFAGDAGGDAVNKSYAARGVVEKIAPDRSQVTIHHQTIPGYMMAMTMDFQVKNTNELNAISSGDEITFTLVVGANDEWVEKINRVGRSAETNTGKMTMPMDMASGATRSEFKPGDLLTDYALTTEEGKQTHLSDFRGKALAFTFFFTRCPLPDFCPRMNTNFEQTRKILLADAAGPTNWQFLSISFDPDFDTPQVLLNYARFYRGDDPQHWLFAAAPSNVLADAALRLDLMVVRQEGSISHNLRTVVLDPKGRIYKQLDGNQWTPKELADAVRQAALMPVIPPGAGSAASPTGTR